MNTDLIRSLAKAGKSESIGTIKKAFAHKDPGFRRAALLGIWDAFRDDLGLKPSNAFKEELFNEVSSLIDHYFVLGRRSARGPSSESDRQLAIEILPKLNATKAAEFLQQPSVLRTSNPDFHVILQCLSDSGIELNQNIEAWLAEFRSKAMAGEHQYARCYGQLIRAAATQRQPNTKEIINDALENIRDSTVTENAAEAQWIMLGLSPTLDLDILADARKRGIECLDQPLQQYVLVHEYYCDAMNGGLSQYFYNTGSDNVRLVLEAVTAMDASEDVYILAEAIKLFGENGPPIDRLQRWGLMEANDRKLFDMLDSIRPPSNISQRFETIVYAKLYLAKYIECCERVPKSRS